MITFVKNLFGLKKPNTQYIIVFANYNYLPVLENWMIAMRNLKIDNYLIIALDEQLYMHLKDKNISTLLRPCELNLGKLWIHRVEVILELLTEGYDVIHSDADAVWLKNPLPYLENLPQDMIFSQGTIWPPDVQKKWGFVLCCGFFIIRSNKKTLQFTKNLLERVKNDKDDQVSCNRLLMEMQTNWGEPTDSYSIDFREKQFICSPQVRTGKCQKLTLALLPHKKFQRIYEENKEVYIRHLISEKDNDNIVDILKKSGCWFTS